MCAKFHFNCIYPKNSIEGERPKKPSINRVNCLVCLWFFLKKKLYALYALRFYTGKIRVNLHKKHILRGISSFKKTLKYVSNNHFPLNIVLCEVIFRGFWLKKTSTFIALPTNSNFWVRPCISVTYVLFLLLN